MADETGTDKLTNESCEVWCNCVHSVAQVVVQFLAVGGDADDLLRKTEYVLNVGVRDLSTHTNVSSHLDGLLQILGEEAREVS